MRFGKEFLFAFGVGLISVSFAFAESPAESSRETVKYIGKSGLSPDRTCEVIIGKLDGELDSISLQGPMVSWEIIAENGSHYGPKSSPGMLYHEPGDTPISGTINSIVKEGADLEKVGAGYIEARSTSKQTKIEKLIKVSLSQIGAETSGAQIAKKKGFLNLYFKSSHAVQKNEQGEPVSASFNGKISVGFWGGFPVATQKMSCNDLQKQE